MDSRTKLNGEDIFALQRHLWPARHKWRTIGIAVGIDVTTLRVIRMDHSCTDDCFTEMLDQWLKNNNPVPCWKNLTTALESVEIKVLLGIYLSCLNYLVQ